jgi:peptidyl-prolyl cis-trans isomerase D
LQPSEADVSKYYEGHQAEFKVPDRVRVNYLSFRTKDFLTQAKVSPGAVEKYIEDHYEEYTRPKVILARQILLPLAPKASPAEGQQAATQIAALEQKVKEGEDFAQLAREHSQDAATKDQGGDLGEVRRGQHPPEWDKVAFALPPGEVGHAATAQGLYLIKVEEIKEKEKIPEAETKAGKQLQEEQARRLAKEKAEQVRAELSGSAMAAVAKKLGVSPQETPLIGLKDPVPGLGVQPAFNQVALGLKPQEVGRVVELPDGFAVLQGVERQAEHLPPLPQIKDQVREAVKKQQSEKRAAEEATRLLKELRAGKTLSQVAAPAGLTVQASDFFTRSQGFPGQRQAESLTSAAFLLSRDKPYPAQPLLWQHKYYLLALKDRREPDPKEFDQVRDATKNQVLEQKRQVILGSWLEAERQRAKIKIFELP